jgi:hypothetical protein
LREVEFRGLDAVYPDSHAYEFPEGVHLAVKADRRGPAFLDGGCNQSDLAPMESEHGR